MRTFYIICFLLIFNSINAQDYVIDREVRKPQISSKLSFGISPFVFTATNRYKYGVGMGIEANIAYSFSKAITIMPFLRFKGLVTNTPPFPGTGYNDNPFMDYGAIAFGGVLDVKPGDRIGLFAKLGYEEYFSYDRYSPGFIYGGGVNIYLNPSASLKRQSSFNFAILFEGDNYVDFPVLDLGTNTYKLVEVNAFIIQIGWRIQFYSVN